MASISMDAVGKGQSIDSLILQGEHPHCMWKGPGWDLNPQPPCYKSTGQTAASLLGFWDHFRTPTSSKWWGRNGSEGKSRE